MGTMEINAKIRLEFGKEKMGKLRRAGMLPAVVYGPKLGDPIHITLLRTEAQKLLNAVLPEDAVIVNLDKKKLQAYIKDVQVDVVTGELLHLDFYTPNG